MSLWQKGGDYSELLKVCTIISTPAVWWTFEEHCCWCFSKNCFWRLLSIIIWQEKCNVLFSPSPIPASKAKRFLVELFWTCISIVKLSYLWTKCTSVSIILSRPGQCDRVDGNVIEDKELEFYLRKIKAKKGKCLWKLSKYNSLQESLTPFFIVISVKNLLDIF